MTFAALGTWQGWLLLAAAGALAAALFLIKLRPPRILIPSLSLWQRVLDASPEVTRWEKIRRAVSLIVTVAHRHGTRARRGQTIAAGRGRRGRARPDAHRSRFVLVDAREDEWARDAVGPCDRRSPPHRGDDRAGGDRDDRRWSGAGAHRRRGAGRVSTLTPVAGRIRRYVMAGRLGS